MKYTSIIYLHFIFISLISIVSVKGQYASIGSSYLDNSLRRNQLIDTSTIIPFNFRMSYKRTDVKYMALYGIAIGLLPLQSRIDYQSNLPYAINNGAMLNTKGIQSIVSCGLFVKWGNFNVQYLPDFLWSQNKKYEGFPSYHNDYYWRYRFIWWNQSDSPERIGSRNMSKTLPGQSYLKYSIGSVDVGYSTENLWWGPGKYNALLMSNNARGFAHFTLNTNTPISTKLGTFEGQLIGGFLNASGVTPPRSDMIYRNSALYSPLENKTRYLSGINLIYQPIWVRGLFIGMSSVHHQYLSTTKQSYDYIPVITDIFRPKDLGIDDNLRPDTYSSFFSKWIWTEGKAALYFEFGKHGRDGTVRDFLLEPNRKTAYVIGFEKLFPIKKENQFIEVNFEVTHLAQEVDFIVQAADSWYIDKNIRHGYTHEGQWLGAGIGPGSNQHTIEINWLKNNNKFGLIFERRLNNSDYYYFVYEHVLDFRRYWIDYSLGLVSSHKFLQFSADFKVQYIYSMNYQYELHEDPSGAYFVPGIDKRNVYISANFTYPLLSFFKS